MEQNEKGEKTKQTRTGETVGKTNGEEMNAAKWNPQAARGKDGLRGQIGER